MEKTQTGLIIVGNHRSGTSALTGCLNNCGLFLGKNLVNFPLNLNPKGYFENKFILKFNRSTLSKIGSIWYDPKQITEDQEKKMLEYVPKLKNILKSEYNDYDFVIKDPRIIFLYPIYVKAFRDLNINMKLVYINRDFGEISKSLTRAHPEKKINYPKLCLKYKNRGQLFLSEISSIIVQFNDLMKDPVSVIEDINQTLDLELVINRKWIQDFIDPNLRNFNLHK